MGCNVYTVPGHLLCVKDGAKVATAATAAVLVALLVCFAVYGGDDEQRECEATVIQVDSLAGFILDVTNKDMERIGADFGYDVYIDSGDERFVAIYAKDFNGIPVGSLFLNYDTYRDRMTIAIYDGVIQDEADVSEGDKLKISVKGINKYYPDIPHYIAGYTDERSDYDSDQEYGNYRMVDAGDVDDDSLYRSASPWLAPGGRNVYCDDFIRDIEADVIFSLDRSDDEVAEMAKEQPDLHASSMVRDGKVYGFDLSPAIFSHPEDIRVVLEKYMEVDGKLVLSCAFGKDRTGIYCTIFEALAGASYEEIRQEFMISICNYYFIEEGSKEYDTVASIYVDHVLYIFAHPEIISHFLEVDWENLDYQPFDAEEAYTDYLIGEVGLSQEFVDALKAKIKGEESAVGIMMTSGEPIPA